MKKILLFILSTSIFLTGCSLKNKKKSGTLREAYFYIVEKNEKTEIELDNIKEVLKNHDLEEVNQEEINQKLYIYSDKKIMIN